MNYSLESFGYKKVKNKIVKDTIKGDKYILTQEEVLHLFLYDDIQGKLLHRNPIKPSLTPAGSEVGNLNKYTGYKRVGIYGHAYSVGQIVWLYHYGDIPKRVYRKNVIKDDNSIGNLTLERRKRNSLTQEQVKYLFKYSSSTGALLHKNPLSPGKNPVGSVAGFMYTKDNSLKVGVYGIIYTVSQIVWMYHGGNLSDVVISKNGKSYDTKIENLMLKNGEDK
jgi:hypothetical protein